MSYLENWPKHLLAPLSGSGFSNALARDFWISSEDLWNPHVAVTKRWLKFVWVYAMSAIAQITIPAVIAAVTVSIFKEVPLRWWFICVGGGTAFGLVLAVLIATTTYIEVGRRARSGGP